MIVFKGVEGRAAGQGRVACRINFDLSHGVWDALMGELKSAQGPDGAYDREKTKRLLVTFVTGGFSDSGVIAERGTPLEVLDDLEFNRRYGPLLKKS